jgi:hypothetical protein
MKKILFAVLLLGTILLIAGCSSGSPGTTASSAGDTTTVSDQSSTETTDATADTSNATQDTTVASDGGTTVSSDQSTDTTVGEDTTTTTPSDTTSTTTPETASYSTATHGQSDSRFSYSGSWKTVPASSADGGSFTLANTSGSSVTIRFIGTNLSWLAKVSPAYGQAKVTVDGGTAKTVNLYSATTGWKKVVFTTGTLKKAAHTVVISWTGKKSAAATGTNIDIDAIKVTGAITGRAQQGNSKLTYAGTWKSVSTSSASGGAFKYAGATGASVTVKFSGIDLAWIAKTGPDYGKAKITVDGSKTYTVDLYSKTATWQKRVWSTGILTDGEHTVKIVWLGTKNSASTGTYIDIDAFDVAGSLE